MAASPSSHPLHTLLACRDISEPEIDIIFCGVIRKIIENPLVIAPRTLVNELVNSLDERLEDFWHLLGKLSQTCNKTRTGSYLPKISNFFTTFSGKVVKNKPLESPRERINFF